MSLLLKPERAGNFQCIDTTRSNSEGLQLNAQVGADVKIEQFGIDIGIQNTNQVETHRSDDTQIALPAKGLLSVFEYSPQLRFGIGIARGNNSWKLLVSGLLSLISL